MNVPVSLSAWSFANTPALVTRLETAFLDHVRARLDRTPYLLSETRADIACFLKRDVPPRVVGDALYLGHMMEWADRHNRKFGAGAVRWSFQAPERLFQPFDDSEPAEASPALKAKREEFLRRFERLDPASRAVLEVECSSEAFFSSGSILIGAGYEEYLDAPLRPFGFRLYDRPEPPQTPKVDGEPEARLTIRHCSLSAVELGLRVFVGDGAARFCMGRGVITDRQNEGLHGMGYHVVGFPLGWRTIHRQRARALAVAVHDVGHAVHWSVRVPPWLRVASTFLFGAALMKIPRDQWTGPVPDAVGLAGDLELGETSDLWPRIKQLRQALPSPTYRKVMEDFCHKMGVDFPAGYEGLDLNDFRLRLLLATQDNFHSTTFPASGR